MDKKKLTFDLVNGYIPFDLEVEYNCPNDETNGHQTVRGVMNMYCEQGDAFIFKNLDGGLYPISYSKPYLLPLSIITKLDIGINRLGQSHYLIDEILNILNLDGYNGIYTSWEVVNNNIIVNIWGEWICTLNYKLEMIASESKHSTDISLDMYNKIIKLLNEYHIDYNDLISQGLAIDKTIINK